MNIKSLFLVLFLLTHVFSQKPSLMMLRYQDDNNALRNDTTDLKLHRYSKAIPLGKNGTSLSLGGNIRLQHFYIGPVNMGKIRPGYPETENYLEQRYMLHSNLQIRTPFRVYTQFTSNHIAGEKTITPHIDENSFDLLQLFGDITLQDVRIRAGRIKVSYGEGGMIGFREGPNVHQPYTGSEVQFTKQKFTGKLFYYAPVSTEEETFDDTTDWNESVFGTYLSLSERRRRGVDLYYFAHFQDSAFLALSRTPTKEKRHTIGFRAFLNKRSFKLSIENSGQWGRFDSLSIRAFQSLIKSSYTFSVPTKPTIEINGQIGSGDRNEKDTQSNTFRSISTRPLSSTEFSIGRGNAVILNPSLILSLPYHFGTEFTYLSIWRFSENDVLYNSAMNRASFQTYRTPSNKQFAAQVIQGEIFWKKRPHYQIFCRIGVMLPEEYLQDCGAEERTFFIQSRISYKF